MAHRDAHVHDRLNVALHDCSVKPATSLVTGDVVEGHYAMLFHRFGETFEPWQVEIGACGLNVRNVKFRCIRDPPSLLIFHIQRATIDFEVLAQDRKSTRLNSSHANISYAVFFLKKKND